MIVEAERFLEALETVAANAILEDDHAALVEAAADAVVRSSRARQFLGMVLMTEAVMA